MLTPSSFFILITAIAIALIAIIAIAKSKILNKVLKRLLIGCLSLILFVTSPLLIIPLNLDNDAAFAAGTDPCATPGSDGVGNVTAIVNSYFAANSGTLNPGVANTTITLGTQSGAVTPVAVGDLLMLIQMQDADINSTNSDSYGDGVSGGGGTTPYTSGTAALPATGASGHTAINNAGRYEFVEATNVSGGGGAGSTITIKGTGTNGGLNYQYRQAAFVAGTSGRRSYQIIRVPQYASMTLAIGAASIVPPWDGTIGGVFAVDVAGQINFASQTLDLRGKGFRGGAGRQLAGNNTVIANSNYDYRTDTAVQANKNGSKGEGIAGTPKYVLNYFNPSTISATDGNPTGTLTFTTNTDEGYPNGSYSRGAPSNAGGGSTDGHDTSENDFNSGGGGGSNGGNGGNGGRSFSNQIPTGGYGGKAFTTTEIDNGQRLIMGGGGGAGTTNNASRSISRSQTSGNYSNGAPTSTNQRESDTPAGIFSSGGAGGGVVIIRANSLTGTGTIDIRGVAGLSTGRDGAGGGGGGGTAYITANTSSGTINVQGAGGPGGYSTFSEAHGPGGGGGGGVIVRKTSINSSITFDLSGGAGGQTGTTNNAGAPNHGAVAGAGTALLIDSVDNPGIKSGDQCIPQLTVSKSTSTPTITKPATGTMTATYKIKVTNAANRAAATNLSISDTLPPGFTYLSTTSVTCTTSTVAAACGTTATDLSATRPTTTNPTVGSGSPSWGTFRIPDQESVEITFNVSIPNTQALGTYQNPAQASYDNPARTVAGGTITAAYISSSSTAEDVLIVGTDYGDAPDTYGTDNTVGNSAGDPLGASHTILSTNNPFIGPTAPDADGTIAATPYDGTGDDVTNIDDEGLTLPALTSSTDSYTVNLNVTNLSGAAANLIGWIDFNYNGKFDSTEASTISIATGSNNLGTSLVWNNIATNSLIPPFATDSQATYARFRITTDAAITTSTPGGAALNGEVEDYPLSIQAIDYGDAPDITASTGTNDYQTTLANSGASHTRLASLRLGTNAPDADRGLLQNAAASSDDTNNIDDEDGVTASPANSTTLPTLTTSSTTYSATVSVFNNTGSPRTLVGWVDFNKDGVFAASEGQTASVLTNASAQSVTLNWSGISGLTAGNTYARFRISDGALTTSTPNGLLGNGEVEDYVVPIAAVPSLNIVKRITNVNGIDITGYVPGTVLAGSDATDLKWPGSANFSTTPQYLRGAIACTTSSACNGISGGKPGDLVEYTIYFLSNGTDNLTNVKICDPIPVGTTFEQNTYGSSQGILLGWDSQASPTTLPDPTNSNAVPSVKVFQTNASDGDKGQFIASPTALPVPGCSSTTNTNGAVVVNVVSGATTVPIATASGTPINSYGFVRFKVKVN